jgi:hypothetical protein
VSWFDAYWFIVRRQWYGVRTPEGCDDGWAEPAMIYHANPTVDRPTRDLHERPWTRDRVKEWFLYGEQKEWNEAHDTSH